VQKLVPVVVLVCNPWGDEQTCVEIFRKAWAEMTTVAVFEVFSGHRISLYIAFLSLVSVFAYIPFVSDYAYWALMAAYVLLAAQR
jgi:hypothetical protein